MRTIRQSVGDGGENERSDVMVIQRLLRENGVRVRPDMDPRNRYVPVPVSPPMPGVTGVCDRNTILHIIAFQEATFRRRPASGIVLPGSSTLYALNGASGGNDPEPSLPPEPRSEYDPYVTCATWSLTPDSSLSVTAFLSLIRAVYRLSAVAPDGRQISCKYAFTGVGDGFSTGIAISTNDMPSTGGMYASRHVRAIDFQGPGIVCDSGLVAGLGVGVQVLFVGGNLTPVFVLDRLLEVIREHRDTGTVRRFWGALAIGIATGVQGGAAAGITGYNGHFSVGPWSSEFNFPPLSGRQRRAG